MRIGWREWLAIPDLGIERIKAKVDTGARSSTLHAFDLEVFERAEDPATRWIRFSVHPLQHDTRQRRRVEVPLVGRRLVRPSTGELGERPVIRVRVRLGTDTFSTDVTLVRRDLMGFRMLLGRRALRGRYLVDSGRSFLLGRPGPPPPDA
ncbi:MAG: RimK/LysX family protein [Acidobacteriota bacterium]